MSNRVIDALKKLLPEEQLNEVSTAIDGMLGEARKELEAEFNQKLEEAYQELSAELSTSEKTAEKGYEEAYAIITDLRNRLELVKEEYEKALEEGYEEAYQMLQGEKSKNNSLEVDIYDEYDKKLSEMKEYIVDKVDEFLQYKGSEIYEQAKRDIINDPRYAEHKVALDKVVETVSNYISDEDYTLATGSKLEAATKAVEELKGQMKLLEARNIRLSHDNTKLTEKARHNAELITEARGNDKKERAKKAKEVSGRGKTAVSEQVEVITEQKEAKVKVNDTDEVLVESLGIDLATVNALAGTAKREEN